LYKLRAAFLYLLIITSILSIGIPTSAYTSQNIKHYSGTKFVLESVASETGWARFYAKLPPGNYTVVSIKNMDIQKLRLLRPAALTFYPDPQLWEKLSKTPIIVSTSSTNYVKMVEAPDKSIELYAEIPAQPGTKVVIELQRVEIPYQAPSTGNVDVAIIAPSGKGINNLVEKIASIHRKEGYIVGIYYTDYIYRNYPEADKPQDVLKPGEKGAPKYNISLALKIISLIRELERKGLKYVVLIGKASDVPPLYYYSPLLSELIFPPEGIVPTDYYYGDIDYDNSVEISYGRIPFSDYYNLSRYVESIERWYEGGEWINKAFISAGATFATTFFIGEEISYYIYNTLNAMNMTITKLFLSEGSYINTRFSPFIGEYGLYYIVAHGSGSSLVDYVPGGLWSYEFEEKLHATEVYQVDKPGLYLLPACRNGYWDNDLVEPPFKPPSLAQALLSRGAAIGYIGFARIAIEIIDDTSFINSRLSLGVAGADYLLQIFVDNLASSETLGEAWRRALNTYLASRAALYRAYLSRGEENIAQMTTREAVFLGDPVLANKWMLQSETQKPQPPAIALLADKKVEINADILNPQLQRYTHGSIYAVNPGSDEEIELTIYGICPQNVKVHSIYRALTNFLIGMEELNYTIEKLNETCKILVETKPGLPSLTRLTLYTNNTMHTFYLLVAGAYIRNDTLIVVGADAFRLWGDEPVFLSLGNTTLIIPGGALSLTKTIRDKTSISKFNVTPLYRYELILGGKELVEEYNKLLELFNLSIARDEAKLEHIVPVTQTQDTPQKTYTVTEEINQEETNSILKTESPSTSLTVREPTTTSTTKSNNEYTYRDDGSSILVSVLVAIFIALIISIIIKIHTRRIP